MKRLKVKKRVMDKKGIAGLIDKITEEIIKKNKKGKKGLQDLAIIGIRTRGAYIAQRIARKIEGMVKISVPLAILDITLYRDDLSAVATQPLVRPTVIPFDLNDKKVILVDDVLYTGRTVRAAMDQIIDFGRPENIQLAVLIDRGWRELPIEANYCGQRIPTKKKEIIDVRLQETDEKEEVMILTK